MKSVAIRLFFYYTVGVKMYKDSQKWSRLHGK